MGGNEDNGEKRCRGAVMAMTSGGKRVKEIKGAMEWGLMNMNREESGNEDDREEKILVLDDGEAQI